MTPADLQNEIIQLRKENLDLKQENAALKGELSKLSVYATKYLAALEEIAELRGIE